MTKPVDFRGAFTALATPFRQGEVDLFALDALIDYQLAGGIHGLVPCGTTGEAPTLSTEEQRTVIARVVLRAKGKAVVIAGTGTNATRESIERTRAARELGADAAMLVMPYYNKPTQRGLVDHVRAVHDAVEIPLVLYNVPSRTQSDLTVASLIEIADRCPRVVAVKEASGNVLRTQEILVALGERLSVLSGDDVLTLPIMALGGTGVISVTSNVAPATVQALVHAMLSGDLVDARARNAALLPLHQSLFAETNPGPLKAALALMDLVASEVRLPLAWPSEATVAAVRVALAAQALLPATAR